MKFISETNFKPTEIGEIPEDWDVVKLGEMVEVDRQKIGKADFKGEVPLVQKINFESGLIILREKRNTNTDLFLGQANRLLISKINFHQGAVSITDREIAATTHYEFFKVLHLADLHFLWIYFRTPNFKNVFAQEIKFRGFKKEANFRYLKNFSIPLPPLSEQKAIAYVLSTIQEAVEKTKKVIEATKELKKSLMKHLFTYGPVPLSEVDKVKLKETEIGQIPEDWNVVKLGEVVESNIRMRQAKLEHTDEIPVLPMSLIPEDSLYIKDWELRKTHEVKSGITVFNGDFLLAKITPCLENGKQGIVSKLPNGWGIATTEVIPIRTSKVLSTEFLAFYLKHPKLRIELVNKMEGTTGRKRLPKAIVQALPIPLPPLPIQQKIAEILSAVDDKIQTEEKKKQALENLFKSMLSNLMTGKIRVKELG
ncbi:MAG TPA: restriction endonuclease subunit S [Candidatus Ratteibacteria bacterium]|nr:restriction endonuclease subunit S [Candidatus Ratteibacteria bacterium]